MKLQLERPGSFAILSLPEVVRASSSPAQTQRVEPCVEAISESRDLVTQPGPDPIPTATASSNPVPVGASTRLEAATLIANSGKSVVHEEAPTARSKRKAPPTSQAVLQAQVDKRKKTTGSNESSRFEVEVRGMYFAPFLIAWIGFLVTIPRVWIGRKCRVMCFTITLLPTVFW